MISPIISPKDAWALIGAQIAHNPRINAAFPINKSVAVTVSIDGGEPISFTWRLDDDAEGGDA